jgi:hypothetical protein
VPTLLEKKGKESGYGEPVKRIKNNNEEEMKLKDAFFFMLVFYLFGVLNGFLVWGIK